jgi:hypothetical protein
MIDKELGEAERRLVALEWAAKEKVERARLREERARALLEEEREVMRAAMKRHGDASVRWHNALEAQRECNAAIVTHRKFMALPAKPWTEGPLYSETFNEFYDDPDDALEEAEQNDYSLVAARIVLCEPLHPRPLTPDYFDDIPSEDDNGREIPFPKELAAAIDAINATTEKLAVGWEPSRVRWDYSEYASQLRPRCGGCGNSIDPDVCHCGTAIKEHHQGGDCHAPVPMGCDCGRATKEDVE